MAVTLDAIVSPRKLDLVGVVGVMEILEKHGKKNPRTGKPYTIAGVSKITFNNPTFPKPWITGSARRLWRRADVERWAPTYERHDGPPPNRAKVLLTLIDSQPEREWGLRELAAEASQEKVFAVADKLDVVTELVARMAQKGQVKRVKRGVYRSTRNGQGREDA